MTPIKITRERNYNCWPSSSDNKIYDDKSDNDKRQSRLNSIAELLEHFRKEDSSQKDDMKSISSSPTVDSTGSISSSSLASSSPDSGGGGGGESRRSPRGPVDHWLSELPSLYESECSVMLQSKSLQGNFIMSDSQRKYWFVSTKNHISGPQVSTNYPPTKTKFTRISRSSRTTHGKSQRVSLNSAGTSTPPRTYSLHAPHHTRL